MQVFVLFIDIHYTDNNRTFDVAPCELTPAPKPITAADLAEARLDVNMRDASRLHPTLPPVSEVRHVHGTEWVASGSTAMFILIFFLTSESG